MQFIALKSFMIKLFLITLILLCTVSVHAESELNANGKCDIIALRRLCNNSPFPAEYVINTPDMVNFNLCRTQSKTYLFEVNEMVTKSSLDLYCKGVY